MIDYTELFIESKKLDPLFGSLGPLYQISTYHAVSLEWKGDTHTRRQRPDRLWSSYDQFTNVPRDGCSSRYRRTSPVISNVTFNQGITYRNWAVLWNLFNIDGKDSIVRNTYFLGLLMHWNPFKYYLYLKRKNLFMKKNRWNHINIFFVN